MTDNIIISCPHLAVVLSDRAFSPKAICTATWQACRPFGESTTQPCRVVPGMHRRDLLGTSDGMAVAMRDATEAEDEGIETGRRLARQEAA